VPKIEELLAKKPSLVNENLSVNYKTTPLHRAASNGNLALVQLLVEKY
jgi:ankyrin repeat protein